MMMKPGKRLFPTENHNTLDEEGRERALDGWIRRLQAVRKRLSERVRDRVRYFNREYFNPFALSFAGRPNSFWSAIQHVGRRSRVEYLTPVIAVRQENCFVIPLPYGQQVDWFRNVRAAGGCRLIYRGRVYRASEPTLLPVEAGLGFFPGWVQSLLRRSDTEAFLQLNQCSEVQDGDARYQSFTRVYPFARGLWTLAALGLVALGIGRLSARRKGSTGL